MWPLSVFRLIVSRSLCCLLRGLTSLANSNVLKDFPAYESCPCLFVSVLLAHWVLLAQHPNITWSPSHKASWTNFDELCCIQKIHRMQSWKQLQGTSVPVKEEGRLLWVPKMSWVALADLGQHWGLGVLGGPGSEHGTGLWVGSQGAGVGPGLGTCAFCSQAACTSPSC